MSDFNVLQLICQVIIVLIQFWGLISALTRGNIESKKNPEFLYNAYVTGAFIGMFLISVVFYGAGAYSIIVELIKFYL